MDKKYFLMLKTHNDTAMNYLCFHMGTEQSCFKYKGSGKYWKLHLEKHGSNISTKILESSEDKNYISLKGVEYSELWDVVKSEKFANLIIEDAQKSFSRIDYIKVVSTRKDRIRNLGFTEKELARGPKTSQRQMGKSMKERLSDPNWVDPRKGKSAEEIYGKDYIHPNKGKKIEGISPDSKPFKFIVNGDIYEIYVTESDFESKTKLSTLMLSKIKKKDQHIIKRQSNTKHRFNDGDIVKVMPISIEDYKMFVR